MKSKVYKCLIITAIVALGLAGCSAEAKVERQLELGASSMEAGDYDKAIEAYEEVVSLDKYEIEGYKGLVIAMDADERGNEEIIQVVKDATAAISEIKKSEEGLSEEDEAAAKDLYVVAVEAVDSNTDDQVTVLENAVEVIGEDGMLPDDFKGMLENALADNVLNGMNTTLAYVEMLEKLLLGDEMPQVEEESEETSTEEMAEESDEITESDLVVEKYGIYVCLGPNADYPETMSDYEFFFDSDVFRITLPNDIFADYEWFSDADILWLYNEEQNKRFSIYSDYYRGFSGEDFSYYAIDGSVYKSYFLEADYAPEKVSIIEHEFTDNYWYVKTQRNDEGIVHPSLACGIREEEEVPSGDVYINMNFFEISFYDTTKTDMDETTMYVIESFRPIEEEESYILPFLKSN